MKHYAILPVPADLVVEALRRSSREARELIPADAKVALITAQSGREASFLLESPSFPEMRLDTPTPLITLTKLD